MLKRLVRVGTLRATAAVAPCCSPCATTPSRFVASTPVALFNLRQQTLEKRRRADLDRTGIDPDAADDEPWILPEEQGRLDGEAAKKKAEEERRVAELGLERDKADAEKKKAFKAWRSGQVRMSRDLKRDRKHGMNNPRNDRSETVDVTVEKETTLRASGELDNAGDYDGDEVDIDEKRKYRKQMLRDRRVAQEAK